MTTARDQEPRQRSARPLLGTADRLPDAAGPPTSPSSESPSAPVRVQVLSRSSITRLGVRALLREFTDRVIVTSRDSDERGVVLLEMTAGDTAQCSVLQHLVQEAAPVVVITADVSSVTAGRAVSLGAVACASLQSSGPDLVRIIETAAAGGHAARPARGDRSWTGSTARSRPDCPEAAPAPCGLSTREWEVLSLVASGVSNADIAATMHLSINSIKTYVRTAYRKIGVHTRTQAVLWFVAQRPSQGLPPPVDAPSSPTRARDGR